MNAHEPTDRRTGRGFMLVFALLTAGILATGYLYYRNFERHYRSAAERQLAAIAELKVGELVQYRKERLGDANILCRNPAFSALVRRFLDQPKDADAQRQLQVWIGKYQDHYQYDRIFLIDTQGVVRMSAPESPMPVASVVLARLPEILRSGQVAFQDFYRHEQNQRVYLSVLVPLRDEADGNRPLGVLVMRIDPATYLYPFIQRWPVLSETAETLLVRREGNEAVFLNELRFQTNTALILRAPLDRKEQPAVAAALGTEGIVEGRDYRGVRVIAAVHAVPDSPWFMVARRDAAEVFAPLRERLWMTVFLVAALLIGTGSGTSLLWRQQRVRFYLERAESAETLRASEVRYRRLFESAKDGILILDAETGMVVDVNPFLIELLGYSREAFLGKKIWELGCFKNIAASQADFAELLQKGYLRYEDKPLETADGRRIEVEFVSNVYEVNHKKVIQCNIRDISKRKQAEQALGESEDRLRTVIEASLDAIIAVNIEGQIVLFNGAAQDLFQYSQEEALNQAVKILLREEAGEIHQKKLERFLSEGVGQCGHIGRRMEKNFRRKDGSLFEAEVSMSAGRHDGLRLVVLAVHDITERKQAEEALRNREGVLQRIFDLLPVGLWFADKDGKLLRGNPAGVKIWGAEPKVSLSEFGIFKARRLPSGEELAPDDWALVHTIRDKVTIVDELLEIDAFDGKKKTILNFTAPVLDAQGEVQGAIVVNLDITERKRAEEELRASEERFRAIAFHTPDHILVQDRDLRYSFVVNPQLGLTEADMIGKTDFDFLRKEEAEKLTTIKRKVLETGEPFHLEAALGNSKGETEFFDGAYVPKRDSTGKVVGLIGYFRNITERKRAAEALRESEATMRYMVKHDPNAIAIYDLNLHYIAVSDRYLHDYNIKEENVIGKHHYEVFPEMPQRWKEVHQRCLSGAIERNDDDYFERPDGSITYNRWECRPWYRADGRIGGIITYTEVTTERKRAEEALRKLSLQLSRAQDEERRRIARELHDSTGQKLAALSMTVGLLQDATNAPGGKTEKMFADCLAMIEQCAQEIRTHSYLLHPPLLDELGLAAAISDYVEGFSKRSGVQVAFDAPPDLERLPTEVEIALFRVVQESLGNIHRHAGASTARIRLACDAEQVTLEVSDQGRGMSAETIRAIEAGRGSAGVGIAGMQGRLRLLGGRLGVESGEQGTTVRAIIPFSARLGCFT